ncbi:uncharacterized protein FIBRA_02578 [Fibroporia radiculosa]|uniref:NAD(P)-binding protein n=1 Tax=Fibroporia radiculosa TaxID=599839 RepID=J4H1X7_9APHY|nr:uncharacterized protein FIBRA_02578 [Fibroporia radiculosa]CCM00544.1 predicted protein [Fibroporia radiculosa]
MPSYLIIGASRSIGLEFIRETASNSTNLVFALVRNRDSPQLAEFVEGNPNRNVYIVQVDVTDHVSFKDAVAKVSEVTGGSLDVLIYNTARTDTPFFFRKLSDYKDGADLDKEFTESYKVNVLGFAHAVNAFLPLLRGGSTKKIVLISSGAGDREFALKTHHDSSAAYGTTKAAVNMIMTKFAIELKKENFVVSAMSPGPIAGSAMIANESDESNKAELARLLERFREAIPDFDPTPMAPDLLTKKMLKVIHSLGPAETGTIRSSKEVRSMEL